MAPRKAARRPYGSGGITWITPSRARLSVWVKSDGARVRRTRVVTVTHRDHGGRGDAQAELDKFAAELAGPAKGSLTVKDVVREYRKHCERVGKSKSTVESYENVEKRLGDFGKLLAADVGPHDLDTFYGSLRLAPATVRHTHAVLSAAFAQAVTWGWVTVNPVTAATPPARERRDGAPLALADVEKLVRAASAPKEEKGDDDPVLAMAIVLSSITGARRGELCGLRWEDVDVDTRTVRIERQWVAGKGGQTLSEPKSDQGRRVMTLGNAGVALVERYRSIIAEKLGQEPEGWLLSPDGGTSPMRAKGLGESITALGRRLGIPVTTHSFRKVASTQLVAAGVDVDTSARRMGHTKEVMLGSYVLGADDRAVAAGATLEARMIDQGLPLGELLRGPS